MRRLCSRARTWLAQEDGQGLVEYGLAVSIIAIAVMLSLQLLYEQVAAIFDTVQTALSNILN